ncbi:MAG: NADH-quinone oxidoreductase subunit N [Paracoccaceae bacterium]
MAPDTVTAGDLAALAPLGLLGLGAAVALLATPRASGGAVAATAAAFLTLALGTGLARWLGLAGLAPPSPGATASVLMADDPLAAFGLVFACATGLATLAFLAAARGEAAVLLLLVVLGSAVLAGARHAATLFLGLEIASLSLVALFAYPLDRRGVEAAYKYLLAGGAASAATALGLAYAFAASGGLALADWAGVGGPVMALGLAFLLIGLAVRLALAPLHMWSPDAFQGAPPTAVALSGALAKGAVALAILRLALEAAPGGGWTAGLFAVAAASVLVGNLAALAQTRLDRMLGYSGVAHSGYLAMLLAAESPLRPEGVAFYVAAYALALVPAVAMLALAGRDATLASLEGLARRDRLAGGAFVVALVSLAGLPVSAGFVAKIYLFAALADERAWAALAVALVGSALGVVYCFRFLLRAAARPAGANGVAPAGAGLRLLLVSATALTLAFGLSSWMFDGLTLAR